jgi:hypothetical protein
MKLIKTLAIAGLLLYPALVAAQKVSVEVEHSGRDNVGKGIVFALKEKIRGSMSMRPLMQICQSLG